ncbi:hypothetical protein ACIQGT_41065 [Streptomyces sp. NPDC093108]|uniref:hypothetical protein n=1 Tax=unclassified Streptomyces TaxID=2593676 RepID=UPI0038095676
MTSARRPLGIGPTTSTRTTSAPAHPRLLPVEQAELGDVDERLVVPERKGRRILGPGVASQSRPRATGAVSPGATGLGHDDAVARRGMPT